MGAGLSWGSQDFEVVECGQAEKKCHHPALGTWRVGS